MNRRSSMKKTAVVLIISVLFLLCSVTYSQEDSRYDSGFNLPFNEKAGDVNPQTGNITVHSTDVLLPGRAGFDFEYGRIWSLNKSNVFHMYRDSEGRNRLGPAPVEKMNRMGSGWSSTLPRIIVDDSSGNRVMNLCYDGNVYEIDQSGVKIYNPNKSNLLGYDLLNVRIYENQGLFYGDFQLYDLDDLAGNGVTDTVNGHSTYVLILTNNEKYWFRGDGNLMMKQDRTGLNRIWYFYDGGGPGGGESKLVLAVDSIGRKISFVYDEITGNLTEINWEVEAGKKLSDGTRQRETELRTITYTYTRALTIPTSEYSLVDPDKEPFFGSSNVIDFTEPFALISVTDPQGNRTCYDYRKDYADFTYDSSRSVSINMYLLLTEITRMYTDDGKYLNKRCFEYRMPPEKTDLYKKYFYKGYMEYFKISRQYHVIPEDTGSRIMNDTAYTYYDNNEAGNYNQYSAVITRGRVKTIYTYSLDDRPGNNQVLDTLLTETEDGFRQLIDYVYNPDRTKSMEETFRFSSFVYGEYFQYDRKGNLRQHEDKMGLITLREYDETYGIPIREVRKFKSGGIEKEYVKETVITDLGHIAKEIVYLDNRPVTTAAYTYDRFGNRITETDGLGNTATYVYDPDYHALPVKTYRDVTISVRPDWKDLAAAAQTIRIRNWKVYNTDGTVWVEIDNDGYGIEHYYDAIGSEIETVHPNEYDLTDYIEPVIVSGGIPQGNDFDDFEDAGLLDSFLGNRANNTGTSRENPGVRTVIDYQANLVKQYTDIDVSEDHVKITGEQKDGLDHVTGEIVYEPGGETIYSIKSMTYDPLGRMISLTDPDAGDEYKTVRINGCDVKRYDKTWVVKYDDLGRQVMVLYPVTEPGRTDIKRISYDDLENSSTTVDPEGRKVYERKDWNGNTVELIHYGNTGTPESAVQRYVYEYDALNRKTAFTDPGGVVTRYFYDERDLLVEQNYGPTGSDRMVYDDAGRIIEKTDRNNNRLFFVYDEMQRNTRVESYRYVAAGNGNADRILESVVEQEYNNRGNAVRIANEQLIEHYVYDHSNRVQTLERLVRDADTMSSVVDVFGGTTGQVFGFTYEYNDMGLVTRMVYPDQSEHTFTYDSYLARLVSIDDIDVNGIPGNVITGIMYNRSGVVTHLDSANGVTQNWEFDNRKRISHISIAGTSVIEDLVYKLNSAGDITGINGNEYTVDGFDRITSAKTLLPGGRDYVKLIRECFGAFTDPGEIPDVTYNPGADLNNDGRINGEDHMLAIHATTEDIYDSEQFSYDPNGNRTRLVQNGDEYTYQYGERNRLEKIYQTKKDEGIKRIFTEYGYDNSGNTISRIIYFYDTDGNGDLVTTTNTTTFVYDCYNRLVVTENQETGEHVRYAYDNAGNRLIKSSNNGSVTLYLRHGQIAVAMDIEVAPENTGETGRINRYILSGDLLAGRSTRIVRPDSPEETMRSWYHLDHLNSTKCVTGVNGDLTIKYEYRAFGEQLRKLDRDNAEMDEDLAGYSYGGKELDDTTNLYYFNARYYDATIGRFINLDPVQDGTNWYVYANNNPLILIDPTGLAKVKPKPHIVYVIFQHRNINGEEKIIPGKIGTTGYTDTNDMISWEKRPKGQIKEFLKPYEADKVL